MKNKPYEILRYTRRYKSKSSDNDLSAVDKDHSERFGGFDTVIADMWLKCSTACAGGLCERRGAFAQSTCTSNMNAAAEYNFVGL
jgi:hypothetical protein